MEAGDGRDHMAERAYGLSYSFGLADDAAVKSRLRKICSPLVAKRILSSIDENDNVARPNSL